MSFEPLDIDNAQNQRWYSQEKDQARATGNWGRINICVPGDTQAWKSACENDFPDGYQRLRWGAYQRSKTGVKECSMNSVRRPRVHPVADGANPSGTNAAHVGCLILEAKSSATEDEQDSLCGIRPEVDDLDLILRRRRRNPRNPTWDIAGDIGEGLGEEFREDRNISDLLNIRPSHPKKRTAIWLMGVARGRPDLRSSETVRLGTRNICIWSKQRGNLFQSRPEPNAALYWRYREENFISGPLFDEFELLLDRFAEDEALDGTDRYLVAGEIRAFGPCARSGQADFLERQLLHFGRPHVPPGRTKFQLISMIKPIAPEPMAGSG